MFKRILEKVVGTDLINLNLEDISYSDTTYYDFSNKDYRLFKIYQECKENKLINLAFQNNVYTVFTYKNETLIINQDTLFIELNIS